MGGGIAFISCIVHCIVHNVLRVVKHCSYCRYKVVQFRMSFVFCDIYHMVVDSIWSNMDDMQSVHVTC